MSREVEEIELGPSAWSIRRSFVKIETRRIKYLLKTKNLRVILHDENIMFKVNTCIRAIIFI